MKKIGAYTIVSTMLALMTHSAFCQKLPFQFEAKGFITFTDADMAASALVDGNLKTDADEKDAFSFIKWTNYLKEYKTNSTLIPNSVVNLTGTCKFSADNKLAFIAPGRGSVGKDIKLVKNIMTDLPSVNKIYAWDMSDMTNPKILDSMDLGRPVLSLDLRKSGDLLAVITEQPLNEVALVEWKGSKFGSSEKNSSGFTGKAKAVDCAWDTSGKYLALTLEETKQVALYYIRKFDKGVAFKLYGEPVSLNSTPGCGKWTADNKHYIVASKFMDGSSNSEISAIKFDTEEGKTHQLTSSAATGHNTGMFSISPDGKYIAAANTRDSYRPLDDPKMNVNSSVSLLTFNTEGVLNKVGEYEFQGIMPKSVDFDAKGNMLAISVFDYWDLNGKSRGGIEFWKVEKGDKPTLKPTGFRLSVPRGIHTLKVIP
jgi:Lactonase, 7-bladed beta-propeller